MHRNVKTVLLASAVFTTVTGSSDAQDFTRTEVGIVTSIVHPNRAFSPITDAGLGGRFTYNLTPGFGIDSELDSYFTGIEQRDAQTGGRALVGLFGPKAGLRTHRYGIFFKARPGFMSFSEVLTSSSASGSVSTARKTHAALDLGALAEFYPSARTVLRVDVGVLLVRYGDATVLSAPVLRIRTIGSVGGPLHVGVGLAYRLGALREEHENSSAPERFAAGAQYSLFTSERGLDTLRDESGAGGWFTWNFSKYVAVDAGATSFPRKIHIADFQQGGSTFQAVAGVRGGIRRSRIGVFGKFRPGIQRYSDTELEAVSFKTSPFTDMAFDAGGIIEVYAPHHGLFRFDAGNTSIYYRSKDIRGNGRIFHISGFTNNTIQLIAGFGFRF